MNEAYNADQKSEAELDILGHEGTKWNAKFAENHYCGGSYDLKSNL